MEAQWAEFISRVRSGELVDLRRFCDGREELRKSVFGDGEPPRSFLDRVLDRVRESPEPRGGVAAADLAPKGTRYEVRGEIARGGMGAILRAFDPTLRRELAMKVILDAGDGTRARRLLPRFLQEAQVTGRLEHPGVVPVHDLGIDDEGRVYFTMRLVEGADLDRVIARLHARDPEWPLPRVLGALSRACEAVAFAHSRGVIHRDLKPANIRLGSFGEVYVMDWGLAKIAAGAAGAEAAPAKGEEEVGPAASLAPLHTRAGTVVGTPAYMPPEQAEGRADDLDARADVYAMGAILYQLLTGAPPYADTPGTPEELVERVRGSPPRSLEVAAPRAPAELVAIARKAMARAPADRYPSMVEMAADLRAFLEDRVVRAHRTGAIAELRKWVRRNRGTAASLALLVLLAIGGSLLWRADADRRYREILRLADAQRLAGAIESEPLLDPPRPERIDAYVEWLGGDVAALRERLPEHARELALRRERALPYTDEDRARDPLTHPRAPELDDLRAVIAERKARIADPRLDPRDRPDLEAYVAEREAEERVLAATVAQRRTWRFADVEERWRHDRLAELVAGLDALFAPEGLADRVAARLELARTIEERSIAGPEARAAWESAIAAIAASPRYGGLRLAPQLGLLPLGENEAGLWEFWHIASGDRPEPAPPGSPSRWRIGPETAVVLVLIPGGTARIGCERIRFGFDSEAPEGLVVKEVRPESIAAAAGLTPGDRVIAVNGVEVRRDADLPKAWPTIRAGEPVRLRVRRGEAEIELSGVAAVGRGSPGVDPWWKDDEGPRHEVRLDPYFIGKYEMTQGQWFRIANARPSRYHAGYPLPTLPRVTQSHPVEQVSFEQAAHWLPRADLALPTEAQWEHAARGGTESVWSAGDEPAALAGHANLDDLTARRTQAVRDPSRPPEEFDDGGSVHVPVGSYKANPFGLHDVHGNVQEHCADWWDEYRHPARAGDGLREGLRRRSKVLRGGSWTTNALLARSAVRGAAPPDQTSPSIGIRAARAVEGPPR